MIGIYFNEGRVTLLATAERTMNLECYFILIIYELFTFYPVLIILDNSVGFE